jgi:hypothetical protein
VPRADGLLDYVAVRDGSASGSGRQDNRGYEGLAISPDGSRLFAVLQDPLLDEGPTADATDNDGRDGRNVRIVVFDNGRRARPTARAWRSTSTARGAARDPGAHHRGRRHGERQRSATGPQHRPVVDRRHQRHEFLVLERDNRGIGVDNPTGAAPPAADPGAGRGRQQARLQDRRHRRHRRLGAVAAGRRQPRGAAGIVPVQKNDADVFIDLAANTLLPNGNQAEKWEGLAIGPRWAAAT